MEISIALAVGSSSKPSRGDPVNFCSYLLYRRDYDRETDCCLLKSKFREVKG